MRKTHGSHRPTKAQRLQRAIPAARFRLRQILQKRHRRKPRPIPAARPAPLATLGAARRAGLCRAATARRPCSPRARRRSLRSVPPGALRSGDCPARPDVGLWSVVVVARRPALAPRASGIGGCANAPPGPRWALLAALEGGPASLSAGTPLRPALSRASVGVPASRGRAPVRGGVSALVVSLRGGWAGLSSGRGSRGPRRPGLSAVPSGRAPNTAAFAAGALLALLVLRGFVHWAAHTEARVPRALYWAGH